MPILKSRFNPDPEKYVFTHSTRKVKESYVTHKFSDYKVHQWYSEEGIAFSFIEAHIRKLACAGRRVAL